MLTDGVASSGLSSTCRVFEGGRALSGPVQSSETKRFSCQEVQINFPCSFVQWAKAHSTHPLC